MALAPFSMMIMSILSKISEVIEFLIDLVTLSGIGAGIWWIYKSGIWARFIQLKNTRFNDKKELQVKMMNFILMSLAPFSMIIISIISKLNEVIDLIINLIRLSGIATGIWWIYKSGIWANFI